MWLLDWTTNISRDNLSSLPSVAKMMQTDMAPLLVVKNNLTFSKLRHNNKKFPDTATKTDIVIVIDNNGTLALRLLQVLKYGCYKL
jgi:hypothetical protein